MDKVLAYLAALFIGLLAGATITLIVATTPGLTHGYALMRECDGSIAALVAVERNGDHTLYSSAAPAPKDVQEWLFSAPSDAVTVIVVPCPAPAAPGIQAYSKQL